MPLNSVIGTIKYHEYHKTRWCARMYTIYVRWCPVPYTLRV